ncbi:wall-associated receptor kinase 3 [Andrographis paniculata]|uniref:wall-associated receptor kinase 3 n=1 Tax=Andrographis paniculata TaxID=175694 RepID=UPI0021E93BFD|nr:wall-associated receptor kinase 3 [Andrographis paniculata]
MKKALFPPLSTLVLIIIIFPFLVSSQTCQKTCGKIPIKYPFGTSSGCGDPRFQPYVACTPQDQLTFTTHTGCYTVTSIDYPNQVIYIYDPSMSTCSCKLPSRGFGLDWDAPFAFHDTTVFALLDCSTDSSPIYKGGSGNNSTFPMCDSLGSSVCSLLYSCEAISRLNLPGSECCVYMPVDLGPSFEMDLQKLQCASYSALYGFNLGSNPATWTYGIAVKYKFNFENNYPELCSDCEKSNGVCGYNYDSEKSFACNCPGGMNTSTDCPYEASWSHGGARLIFVPPRTTWIVLGLCCFVWLILSKDV